jgi:ribonuclease Z
MNVAYSGVLLDCGEGTQIRLKMFKIKINSIDQVFISHIHGDHFFGLVGLISTFHLLNRSKPLTVYGPKELEHIVRYQLEVSQTVLCYELNFVATNHEKLETIFENDKNSVVSFPIEHSVPTTGFLYKEKTKKPNSYAYCSDTIYKPDISETIKDVDVLYHEATFLSDLQQAAIDKLHATAREAAMIAKDANAKKLIIGHFSKRYSNKDLFTSEAREVFPETIAAEDGMTFEIQN